MAFIKSKEDLQRYVLGKLANPAPKSNQLLANFKSRITKQTIKSPLGK